MPIQASVARKQEDASTESQARVSNEDLLKKLSEVAMRPKEVATFLGIADGASGARLKRHIEKGYVRKIRLNDPDHDDHGKIFYVAVPSALKKYEAAEEAKGKEEAEDDE